MIISLLFTFFLNHPPFEVNAASELVFQEKNVEFADDIYTITGGGSIYTKHPTLSTKPINVDVGSGHIITKIEFFNNDEVVKTIRVNAQTFSSEVSLTGEGVPLSSKENEANGAFISYQRSSSDAKWTLGISNHYGYMLEERLPESRIEKETVGGIVRDKYPGNFFRYEITYPRSEPFKDAQGTPFDGRVVDDNRNRLRGWNQVPGQVDVNWDQKVQVPYYPQIEDYSDRSTVVEQYTVVGITDIVIQVAQTYDHMGHKIDLPATGAAMMYYLSAFIYDMYSYTYKYPGKYKVYYQEGPCTENCEPDEPEPGGVVCTPPSPKGSMAGEDFNPNVSAMIKADSRGSERFDVLDGIPTTESLYGNVWTKDYLHKYGYQEMGGTCTFTVDVKVMPPPPPPGEQAGEPSTVQVQVDKDYSFWTIAQVEVYQIKEAALWNYAFDGNGIRIQPNGYNAPYYATAQTHHYEPSDAPSVSVSHNGDPEAAARNAVSVRVRNDTFTFYNQTLMNGTETTGSGPAPSPIPTAPMTGDNVLYSPGNVVPMSKTNKASQPSTGTIYYTQVSGSAAKDYPIYGINPVTVHTPVVIYPDVSDDKAHNQKTNPAAGRSAIILDRPFTIDMPNSGQHTSYLGYGNRNYLKYIGSKQVRFPFDVYDGSKTQFYPKNTWIEVEKSQESFTFFLPVWVDEGFYDVEFRTIAHNASADASHQTNANLDLTHHIAYDTVPVDAIGRVYDLRITDIADYNWETVFRTAKGSSSPTGTVYWVGQRGIDGAERGIAPRYTLPIRPGSHPLYSNISIKRGYHFKFDLKTKGNMFGLHDQITIKPSFYFISAEDGSRTPVDLYYHRRDRSYVKVGSPNDEVARYVILNERLRNVPMEELQDTALYQYDHDYTFDQVAHIGREQFVSRYVNIAAKNKTPIGSLSLLRLPEGVRTLIGPKTGLPAGVDPGRVNAAVQKWYGEYSLPADLYAVKSGTNVAEYGRTHQGLTDKSPIFLKKGYIVVNFNIETVRNGQMDAPHLQYIDGPLMNQWYQMEGFSRSVQDPSGVTYRLQDGDVVLYDADRSSRDDFSPMVTH